MTDSAAINEIMLALKKWTDEKVHSPSLLVSTDNGSFHVAYYAGMGSYDSVPIEITLRYISRKSNNFLKMVS